MKRISRDLQGSLYIAWMQPTEHMESWGRVPPVSFRYTVPATTILVVWCTGPDCPACTIGRYFQKEQRGRLHRIQLGSKLFVIPSSHCSPGKATGNRYVVTANQTSHRKLFTAQELSRCSCVSCSGQVSAINVHRYKYNPPTQRCTGVTPHLHKVMDGSQGTIFKTL